MMEFASNNFWSEATSVSTTTKTREPTLGGNKVCACTRQSKLDDQIKLQGLDLKKNEQ